MRLALEIGLFTIIREKEFTFYPQNARIQTQYIDPFLTTYSQLRLITLPQDFFPLNRLIQEFFRNTDFGLVDPSRPPSEDNLPLSLFVQRLIDSGTISRAEFYRLFRIYTIYHQHQDGPLILDEKTGPVIEPGILTINRERIRRSQSIGSLYPEVLLPVDAIELNLLFGYAPAFLNPNLETFTEYDLPRPLSEEEFRSISDLIYSAHRFYMITNSLRFYRTDGCFFEFN